MSATNLYKRIVTPQMVEQAVVASLGVWMPDYLGELERLEGYDPGQVQTPRGIITVSEFAKWDADQVPLVIVASPGLAAEPHREAQGAYEAAWRIEVAAIVSDQNEIESRRLASTYAGAIRAAISQHKMLKSPLHPDGFADFTRWRGEVYSDLDFVSTRTLDSCRVIFTVGVEDVLTEQAGPREPTGKPGKDPGPLTTITEVDIDVKPESILA